MQPLGYTLQRFFASTTMPFSQSSPLSQSSLLQLLLSSGHSGLLLCFFAGAQPVLCTNLWLY
jgi:hypothetical protein